MSTMVHVRIDGKIKLKATKTLKAMGLSVSDVVRILLVRVVAEQTLPFDVKVPNAASLAAMKELKKGKGKCFRSIKSLMGDLNEG